ncbi:hypothetical protein CO726_26300 [Bacillus fungorum]|uniref:Uncharacterized protein n=1 Tax=Bacillus fungorum TaxID=2039284 RepID=A0A2G6Q6K9_9BACI|nr:hypothetical protein [Bacillus fungorum]PIE92466.1 hypothetical protein CO726_26300 [Bacillus fungorum]
MLGCSDESGNKNVNEVQHKNERRSFKISFCSFGVERGYLILSIRSSTGNKKSVMKQVTWW